MRIKLMIRIWQVPLVAALAAVLLIGASSASGKAQKSAPFTVLAFQSEGSSPTLIDRNRQTATEIGTDGIDLIGPGIASSPDQPLLAQLARAKADGLPAVLLLDNWSDRINDFSEPLAYQTLRSADSVSGVAAQVAADVQSAGWSGVSIDLESLLPRDSQGLTQLVADLRADLPQGASLSVCISAYTTLGDYQANGYDLQALAASADHLVLMTYDDHGPWENTPGPIGPIAWQRQSVAAAEQAVPASQILLGIANYAYAWRPHSNDNLDVAQARQLAAAWKAHPHWNAAAGEWTASLKDGSTLWWSDARSMHLRFALARKLGLPGVAVWSLGSGDKLPVG